MVLFIFVLLMLGVFGKMIGLAIRCTWGITKVAFSIIFLPIVLIVLVVCGLMYLALPALVILGIVMLVRAAVR